MTALPDQLWDLVVVGISPHVLDVLGLGDGRLTPRLVLSLAGGLVRNRLTPTGAS